MNALWDRYFKEAPRFLFTGVLNTLWTYILYLLALQVFNYQLAYGISFVAGVLGSYWLNLRYVFRKRGNLKKFALYPLVYFFQYVLSALFLEFFVHLGVKPVFAPLLVVLLTVPITFLLIKKILT